MATATTLPMPPQAAPAAAPPLRDGDRMDRFEFLRRWLAAEEPRPKCELVEGVVCFYGLTPHTLHGRPHAEIGFAFGYYGAFTPGVSGGLRSSLCLGRWNMPDP